MNEFLLEIVAMVDVLANLSNVIEGDDLLTYTLRGLSENIWTICVECHQSLYRCQLWGFTSYVIGLGGAIDPKGALLINVGQRHFFGCDSTACPIHNTLNCYSMLDVGKISQINNQNHIGSRHSANVAYYSEPPNVQWYPHFGGTNQISKELGDLH